MIGKRELFALLSLSSWCLVIVVWFVLSVPRVCLQFVILVIPDHTHYFSQTRRFASAFPAHMLRLKTSMKPRAYAQDQHLDL